MSATSLEPVLASIHVRREAQTMRVEVRDLSA